MALSKLKQIKAVEVLYNLFISTSKADIIKISNCNMGKVYKM